MKEPENRTYRKKTKSGLLPAEVRPIHSRRTCRPSRAPIIGGNFFVDGASGIARGLGVSESIIGLTLVAGGTSLPELATSIVAALKKTPK